MRHLSIYIFTFLLTVSCRQTNEINKEEVDHIELIQVDHPYIGDRVDSIKLNDKLVPDFLLDFADKREEDYKFYSCYVIKIHFKDGEFISYRTNGQLFEKFKDDNTTAIYFKLNRDLNVVTKYWGIGPDKFCKPR